MLFIRTALGTALAVFAASGLSALPGWSTSGPPLPQVSTIAAAPDAGEVVYASGTQLEARASAIYSSTDGGTKWTPLFQAPPGDYWSEVFVDPRDSTRLFAGAQTAAQTTTIYRSTNTGGSWNLVLTISTTCGPSFAPGFGADALLIACGTRLFQTPDAGLTWSELTPPFTETTRLTPGPASAVFAYGPTHVFRSSDQGATWQDAGGAPTGCAGLLAMRVDPGNTLRYVGGVGMLGTGGFQCGGVYTSNDGGQSWTPSDLSGVYVTDVRLDPTDPKTAYACASFISGLLPKGGVWRSTDGGHTWDSLRLPVKGALRLAVSSDGSLVHAATPSGAYDLGLRKTRVVGPR